MPEPITFTNEESPALSPENIQALEAEQSQQAEGEEPSLLAGKYKSVEELEKAYKELQTKLSQGKQAPPAADDAEPAADAEPEAEEEAPPAQSAKEIYGEAIGSRLEEAGIDFGEMNTRWQQSGELTADDYSSLEEAGFTKDMVDAYLSGLQYRAAQDSALSVQQITEIKNQYGGEKGYTEMMQWAEANLTQEEIDGFNEIVNGKSMAATRMAVAGIHARYTASEGREPKLLGGRAPRDGGEKFESTAQVVEAMKDPRYSSDPAYRRKVEQKLARSSIM
jgi:pyruvate/2-oxoglutarate dehydrogenase complex dihydrolipoamide acyltransferase (E2) component